jgi:hypothetical protein
VFVLQGLGVALMPETSTPRPGALASIRPRFALPPQTRRPLLLAVPALVAVWALAGLYGALGPALVRLVSGSGSIVLGGLSLSVLAASGAVAVLQKQSPRTLTLIGATALAAGVGLTVRRGAARPAAGPGVGPRAGLRAGALARARTGTRVLARGGVQHGRGGQVTSGQVRSRRRMRRLATYTPARPSTAR